MVRRTWRAHATWNEDSGTGLPSSLVQQNTPQFCVWHLALSHPDAGVTGTLAPVQCWSTCVPQSGAARCPTGRRHEDRVHSGSGPRVSWA